MNAYYHQDDFPSLKRAAEDTCGRFGDRAVRLDEEGRLYPNIADFEARQAAMWFLVRRFEELAGRGMVIR